MQARVRFDESAVTTYTGRKAVQAPNLYRFLTEWAEKCPLSSNTPVEIRAIRDEIQRAVDVEERDD